VKKVFVQEEILDLVDENDQVIGSAPRSEIYKKAHAAAPDWFKGDVEDLYSANAKEVFNKLRAVWLMLINSKGELWIPRRNANKKICPLYLEGSMVGHVSSGETYEEALIRETKEELNLDLTRFEYRFKVHLSPFKDGSICFSKVYELRMDETPNFSKEDFQEGYWLKPEKILEMLASGDKSKQDLPLIVKRLYL